MQNQTASWARLSVRWLGVVCALSLLGACHDEEAEKKKIAEIQKEADEKIKSIQKQADQKVADAEKQVEQVKQEMAAATQKMKAEADDAVSKAQASAEEQAKAAQAALAKARGAFKEEGRLHLANVNKEVTELAQKSAKAPAKVKEEVAKAMKQIVAKQKDIAKDIAAFDKAELADMKKVQAKLNQDLALMKNIVRAAKAKVPAS